MFTVDRKQGDIDVTVDHRLFTEKGRNQIAEDILVTDMFRESLERAITTERVGITDFFDETGKQLNVYNAVKQSIADDPSLAAKLQDPDLPAETKEQMLDQLTHAAIKSLGYDAEGYGNKIIAKEEDVRQGFHSEETGDSYINDHNIYDTEGLVNVAGHEMSHAIDDQSGDVNRYSEQDRETYAENIGSDFVDYTDTALGVNGHGSMASSNNHVGNSGKTVSNNNAVFDQLDKNNGDNAIPLIVVAGLALELIDKGITAYEAYKLEEALSEGRMDEAKELATDLGVGLATEAIPGNKIAIKVVGAVKDVVKGADKADTVKDLNQLSKIGDEMVDGVPNTTPNLDNIASNVGSFAGETKLIEHFEKHGAEFGVKNPEEYLSIANEVMKKGDKVEYMYKGEKRIGYVQVMGVNRKGQTKFAFVGTNSQGNITTLHTKSGKDFWKTINGDAKDKVIRPVK